jgi:dTDP-4-amino-4,6-dideoxygalactose transaminase
MTVPLVDLLAQFDSIREEISDAMDAVLATQRFILGPEVDALEEELAAYLGVSHAIGVASGTDALLLPLKALDAPSGSDVLVPSFTFFASAGAVWNAGLTPVFCDVDPGTFNITPESLEAAWTDNTVAVVVVHLFGQMADMQGIRRLADSRGAFVLEDAAQSVGARSILGAAGSLGDAGALSFFPTKNLGCFGDGGLVTTNDEAFADRIRRLRVHGGLKMYHHEMVGTNSRLDALQAAVLRVKLRHLDAWTARRQTNADLYGELLEDLSGVRSPEVVEGNVHVYNQYTIRTPDRDALRDHLTQAGIETGVYYPVPLHLQECFRELGYAEGQLPVSERLCREVLSLPVFPELKDEDLRRVADCIHSFRSEVR